MLAITGCIFEHQKSLLTENILLWHPWVFSRSQWSGSYE